MILFFQILNSLCSESITDEYIKLPYFIISIEPVTHLSTVLAFYLFLIGDVNYHYFYLYLYFVPYITDFFSNVPIDFVTQQEF